MGGGASWEFCKRRIFPDPGIEGEVKIDIWNAVIGIGFKYGMSPLSIAEEATWEFNNFLLNAKKRIKRQQNAKESHEDEAETSKILIFDTQRMLRYVDNTMYQLPARNYMSQKPDESTDGKRS